MRPPRLALLLALFLLALGGPLMRPPAARAAGGALVPLPDGRVLAIGTRLAQPAEQARLVAARYDPATDRWTQQSSSGVDDRRYDTGAGLG